MDDTTRLSTVPTAVLPTRRVVMSAAAWTIPVVAVASAAPFAAASAVGVPASVAVVSDSEQPSGEVNLVLIVSDDEGNTISAGVRAHLDANSASAVFLAPDESSADGLDASVITEDDGLAVFPIDVTVTEPVELTITITSGTFVTTTTITVVP
jgi:hypothetical protein